MSVIRDSLNDENLFVIQLRVVPSENTAMPAQVSKNEKGFHQLNTTCRYRCKLVVNDKICFYNSTFFFMKLYA